MYKIIVKPLLFKQDPETIHYKVFGWLKILLKSSISKSFAKRIYSVSDTRLEKELKLKEKELNDGYKSKVRLMSKELEEKNTLISKLFDIETENEKLKREKRISEKKLSLEIEKAKNEITKRLSVELENSISEKYELKIAEKNKQIEQVKKSAEDAAKKANQGSMQIQGEVQEEAIEKYLLKSFPFDQILEVKKGHLGADCLQIINEFNVQNCGKIYYLEE